MKSLTAEQSCGVHLNVGAFKMTQPLSNPLVLKRENTHAINECDPNNQTEINQVTCLWLYVVGMCCCCDLGDLSLRVWHRFGSRNNRMWH